ncbi:hypothetical protein PYK79_47300 [Streptomyces sp. ID05-04B]|uniref:hypothetical protein n=1 Tax=Streptomyces sp. ID05-04B TaxID=3028661 RepID=UPI0029C55C33|nr:hypothetical protein [Streptomyces sp. ID05-04B]MDX5569361.1 hypothetical protein [Streptomyces sp. ID05-04B]
MTERIDTIAAALRNPVLRRAFVGHELRGSVVQGLGPGSTVPEWTATVPMLAEAIDTALTRAEEKDIPAASTPAAGTPSTPHALAVTYDGVDLIGTCCGRVIGRTPPTAPLAPGLVGLWQRHTGEPDPDQAWAAALTALTPAATPNGAS